MSSDAVPVNKLRVFGPLHCISEPVIFVLQVWFNGVLSVHIFSLIETPSSGIGGRDWRYEQWSQSPGSLHRRDVLLKCGRSFVAGKTDLLFRHRQAECGHVALSFCDVTDRA